MLVAVIHDMQSNILIKFPGNDIHPQGTPCSNGLTAAAASDLDLRTGMAVAVGILDAHSGAIGEHDIGI